MPERTTISQIVQIGVESTPGTSVAATKKLTTVEITPAIKTNVEKYRGAGYKYATVAAMGKEWVEAGIKGGMTYTELVYLLSSLLKTTTAVIINDGPGYTWSFAPATTTEDTVKTFTVEHGSSVRAGKFLYGLVTGLAYEITREKCEITGGTMLGRGYTDGASLSGGATELAIVPILPTQVSVYLDSTAAGLGGTKLTRVLSVGYEMSNRFGTVWPINAAETSWAAHVELEPTAQLKLKVEADSSGMALLTNLRAGSSVFVRVEAIGPLIETAVYYKFVHDIAGKVMDISEFSDQDGVYAVEFTIDQVHDATWGKSMNIDVVNLLTAL